MNNTIKYTELTYGEMYLTTKEHTFSNFDENYTQITIPEGEKLMFRSFQPYGKHVDKELALFFWLKHKTTVCLVVCEKTPILHMNHIEWDKRNDFGNTEIIG